MRRDIEEYGLDPHEVRSAWNEWTTWGREALVLDDRRIRAEFIL